MAFYDFYTNNVGQQAKLADLAPPFGGCLGKKDFIETIEPQKHDTHTLLVWVLLLGGRVFSIGS